jgi:hypothetical protein
MNDRAAVPAPVERGSTRTRTVIRLLLVIAAFVLLWAGDRQFAELIVTRSSTYTTTWAGWLGWIGFLALSGVAFGLAGWLPSGFGYRPGRALLLGVVPLLMLIHATLVQGPRSVVTFSLHHLGFLYRHIYFFDGLRGMGVPFALALMLGVAIAAGFSAA